MRVKKDRKKGHRFPPTLKQDVHTPLTHPKELTPSPPHAHNARTITSILHHTLGLGPDALADRVWPVAAALPSLLLGEGEEEDGDGVLLQVLNGGNQEEVRRGGKKGRREEGKEGGSIDWCSWTGVSLPLTS